MECSRQKCFAFKQSRMSLSLSLSSSATARQSSEYFKLVLLDASQVQVTGLGRVTAGSLLLSLFAFCALRWPLQTKAPDSRRSPGPCGCCSGADRAEQRCARLITSPSSPLLLIVYISVSSAVLHASSLSPPVSPLEQTPPKASDRFFPF